MKKFYSILAIAVATLSFNAFAGKKETKKTEQPSITQEQMEEAMKLGAPSDAHKKLDAFVGNWTYTGKFWMDPSQKKPEVMTGTNENEWILGGRFLQAKATGEATNEWPAFEGMGLTGYDNVKQEYTSTWVDNMSTSTMSAAASFDDKAKTLTEEGSYFCPMTKSERHYRAMWKVTGKDSYKYISYMKDENGKEYKAMEIDYKRAK
ncbi:MAG: DUF1579 domain-containing protein [Bdellovibrionales bacterium]|nr:DUF1579 domain-containing protein [Bdellovibrionales bacterium]